MCGIAGIFDVSARAPVDRDILKKMNDAIAHRGPDGEGTYFAPGVGLAHRRLAIIDLAGGRQPMFNEDGSVAITFNGEIYNFQELKAELLAAGHAFRTHSDTEVIVHAWEQWGPGCLARFRGMFAFAIYDRNQDVLFLARDRLGKKPLYYGIAKNRHCLFASELKALLASAQFAKSIRPASVDTYLAFGYVPDPDTIYDGIFKLPPGTWLRIERGRAVGAPVEYWRPRFKAAAISEEAARATLIEQLREAVDIRLVSDVPLGAFLSGGVDSSGVVAMMAGLSRGPIKTFCIGFGEAGEDDVPFAEAMSQRYGTEHRIERVTPDYLSAFREQAAIFDEPFADSSSVPTYQVSKLARRHVTVALSGDAGDELFAGYRRYRLHRRTETIRSLIPGTIRAPLFGSLGHVYPKLDQAPRWLRAKYTFKELAASTAEGYYRTLCRIHDDQRSVLYTPAMRHALGSHHPADLISQHMREADTTDPVALAEYVDVRTYLAGDILTKVDRASMAASLEVRVPMLDHHFVEWAGSVPAAMKLRGDEGKYILKRALEPYVPHENLYRAKRGFAASLARQFRGAGAEKLRLALMGEMMGDCGLLDIATIGKVIDEHDAGRFDHSQALWSLLMFSGFLAERHFNA
jgi:asparagine synthase (glutamine-hydrolysing)